jgi:hypothetical protein
MKRIVIVRELSARLRPIPTSDLTRVGGSGESASTSTSGTPAAGDDTVGDQGGDFVPTMSFSLNFSRID